MRSWSGRLVAGYAACSAAYIVVSDQLLARLGIDGERVANLGMWKGLCFVAVTSAALAWLLSRFERREREAFEAWFLRATTPMLIVGDGRIVAANGAAERFYGHVPTGGSLELGAAPVVSGVPSAMTRWTTQATAAGVREVELHVVPTMRDGREVATVTVVDVTETRRAARAEVRRALVQDALLSIDRALFDVADEAEVCAVLAARLVATGAAGAAWVEREDAAGARAVVAVAGRAGRDVLEGAVSSPQWPGRSAGASLVVVEAPTAIGPGRAAFVALGSGPGAPVLGFVTSAEEAFGEAERALLSALGSTVALTRARLVAQAERQRALEASRMVAELVEASPAVLFRWRNEAGWPVAYVSSNVLRWGWTPEELLSGAVAYASLVHPDDLERVGREVDGALASGVPEFELAYRIRAKSGAWLDVADRTRVVRDPATGAVSFEGVVDDVTARVAAERARRTTEAALSDVLARAPVVLATQDAALRYTSLSAGAFTPDPSRVLGKTDLELLPGPDAEESTARKREVLATGRSWSGELRRTLVDGPHVFETTVLPLLEDGRVVGVRTVALDVTARRRSDDARAELETLYRTMFEANPHAMWLEDRADGRLLAVNDAALELYGRTREELLSLRGPDLRASEVSGPPVVALPEGVGGGGVLERHRRADGTVRDVAVSRGRLAEKGREADVVLALDVTPAVAARRELVGEKERFRALTEQSFVGVFLLEGERVRYLNPRLEALLGLGRGEAEGRPFLEFIADADAPRVTANVQALLDGTRETVRDEFDARPRHGVPLRIGAEARRTVLDGRPGVLGVAQDITEKARAEAREAEYVDRLQRAVLGTVGAVSRMVELRDPYTAGHERRVGELAAAIGRELGLDDDTRRGLLIAGTVHDAGKIAIPAEILTKPGKLTKVEYEMMKGHAEQGYEVLKGIDFPWPVALVARQHHERIDGTGYPLGLKGTEITLEARIVAVADVVESMASHRPYRPTRGLGVALEEIEQNSGKLYDREVAAACLRLFRERGYTLPE